MGNHISCKVPEGSVYKMGIRIHPFIITNWASGFICPSLPDGYPINRYIINHVSKGGTL